MNSNTPRTATECEESAKRYWLERQERFDAVMDELDKKFEPWIKALRDSERITEADLALRINARDEDCP